MRTLIILFIFIVTAIEAKPQYVDRIGGSLGLRVSNFTLHSKKNITTTTPGYSSLYCLDLNLRRNVFTDVTFLYTGINFAREQIGFYPLIKINEIPQFNTQFTDSFNVFEFRMWNYQIGIPLKFGLKLYKGWMDFFPLLWIPAININAGIINNFIVSKTYNDVILAENYGTTNEKEFFDEAINRQVSSYYLKTIGNYNLIGQLGLDIYAPLTNFEFGFNLALNQYLTSPFSQKIDISNDFSMDVKLFVIFKLKNKTEVKN